MARNPLSASAPYTFGGNPLSDPSVPQGPSIADAWSHTLRTIRNYVAASRQRGIEAGNIDPETGWPTEKAIMDGIDQYKWAMIGGTGIKGVKPGAQTLAGIKAYHGSPHSFDRFSTDKIGTGEGAQAYGRGLYFAENEGVARSYKGAGPAANAQLNEINAQLSSLAKQMNKYSTGQYGKYNDPRGYELRDQYIALMDKRATLGHMYEVNIKANPEHFLDWDKPLYQQTEHVRNALGTLGLKTEPQGQWTVKPTAKGDRFTVYNVWGEPSGTFSTEAAARAKADAGTASHNSGGAMWAYSQLGGNNAYPGLDKPAAADALRQAGIPGIRYLDAGSRGNSAEPTYNHVVFDDATIEILRKYGLAGLMGGGAAAAATQGTSEQ